MGAITFSLDETLLSFFTQTLAIKAFVETGTFKGDSIALAKNHVNTIYSVELSPEYYEQAKTRFSNDSSVNLFHGNSPEILSTLKEKLINESVFYWLDAHWCASDNTAGGGVHCPLLAEIEAIENLNENSVIVIDDARLFQSPIHSIYFAEQQDASSQWPMFDEILEKLNKLSAQHIALILNDCIIFYPKAIREKMKKYASEHSVDWLTIADKSRDYEKVVNAMQLQDQEIKRLAEICQDRLTLIEGKNKRQLLKLLIKRIL